LPVLLNLSGRHNVLNALAVIALAHELKLPDQQLLHSLAAFQGVGRRFQCYADIKAPDGGVFTLIDDYGHHPVEMTATLAAARGAFAGRRLVLVFQPHRYSRTRDCWDQFLTVMAEADAVVLTEVYSAGEAPLAGTNGRGLAHALHLSAGMEPVFVADIEDMAQAILEQVRGGDVVLCMGAGSIEAVPVQVLALATGAVGRTQEEGER
jgi:UDP-N-acetylmuramate--alanine ligase